MKKIESYNYGCVLQESNKMRKFGSDEFQKDQKLNSKMSMGKENNNIITEMEELDFL